MITPIQHLAVRYLAAGWSDMKTATELKLTPGIIKAWKRQPEFLNAVQSAALHHAELLESMLLHGEMKATETLIEALRAETKGGQPAWQVRVMAAMNLMDRAGKRGKAIDRAQVASVSTDIKAPAEVEHALRNALRDPGVRAWLQETGSLGALLSGAETAEDAPLALESSPIPEEGIA